MEDQFSETNYLFVPLSADGSKCQKQKGLGERRKDAPKLIPECESNGEFKSLHCFMESGKKMCQCRHPKTGDLMKGPSESTKTCECVMARHEAEKKSRSGCKLRLISNPFISLQ